jgi:hypothetical protein
LNFVKLALGEEFTNILQIIRRNFTGVYGQFCVFVVGASQQRYRWQMGEVMHSPAGNFSLSYTSHPEHEMAPRNYKRSGKIAISSDLNIRFRILA